MTARSIFKGIELILLLLGFFSFSSADAKEKKRHPPEELKNYVLLGEQKINFYCLQGANGLEETKAPQSIALDDCQNAELLPNGWPCEKTYRYCHSDGKRPRLNNCLQPGTKPFQDCRTDADAATCLRPARECTTDSDDTPGSFIANVIGRIGDLSFISVWWNGGGSGNFSQLQAVKLEPNNGHPLLKTLLVQNMGDMVNGGMTNEHIDGDSLRYENMMTDWDFLSGSGVSDQHMMHDFRHMPSNHHDGVYTTALYHLTPPNLNPVFDGIGSLDDSTHFWADYRPYSPQQSCLQKIMLDEEKKHHDKHYTPDEYHYLGRQIEQSCFLK